MTFGERYAQTGAQIQAYVAGLPVWVNVWRGWMFLVFTLAVVFAVRSREARWLGVTMIVSLFAYNLASMAFGVGRFPSIAFLVFWTPLGIYLARRRSALPKESRLDRVYAAWVTVALATLVVSLCFDTYNVAYSLVRGVP